MTNYQIKREVLKLLRLNLIPFHSDEYGLTIMHHPVRFSDDCVLISFPNVPFLTSVSFPYEKASFLRKLIAYTCKNSAKLKECSREPKKPMARLQRRLPEKLAHVQQYVG